MRFKQGLSVLMAAVLFLFYMLAIQTLKANLGFSFSDGVLCAILFSIVEYSFYQKLNK